MNQIKAALRDLGNICQWQILAFRQRAKSLPVYVVTPPNGLKVHLGAGPVNIQGWVNVDSRGFDHTHIISDGFSLEQFTDESISEIYMCHVLEHFSFEESKCLLKKLWRKLAIGGTIRISVPDFDALLGVYHLNGNNLSTIQYSLMGGQDYEHNFHKSIYNRTALSAILADSGFSDVMEWNPDNDFGPDLADWSKGELRIPGGQRKVSLNLKALKTRL